MKADGIYFDAGEPCGTVGFEYPAEELDEALSPDLETEARQAAMSRLLEFFAGDGAPPVVIGRRILLYKYLIRHDEPSQAALGRKLKISQGRISQLLIAEKARIAALDKAIEAPPTARINKLRTGICEMRF